LKDVSFTINPGESIALVGHTGSGKRPLRIFNALLRRAERKNLLDGVDVREWDLQDLRENFAVVLQDVFLFSGSLAENIRLGNRSIDDEKIRWAAREVHADEFIEKLEGVTNLWSKNEARVFRSDRKH
jgi:ATP-binding cassette subfamily B protein